jgi:hypothetical protein
MSVRTIKPGIRRVTCFPKDVEKRKLKKFTPQPHQQTVTDYFINSPHKGILLYHKLGSGKSCTSIMIADRMIKEKKVERVFICTPGSLRKNYVDEYCKLCGTKKLNKYFTFITYNYNIFESMEGEDFDFNNSLVVIDEAHNLINGAKNFSKNPDSIYWKIINSNARVVILTATVVFNNVFEWCLLGNLLKEDTFPNILNRESKKVDKDYFEINQGEILSDENMKGIISFFPGHIEDFPEVIYNEPIKILMTPVQTKLYEEINAKEQLARKIGPATKNDWKINPKKAAIKNKDFILASKYIRSRSISNVHYIVNNLFEYNKIIDEDFDEEFEEELKEESKKKSSELQIRIDEGDGDDDDEYEPKFDIDALDYNFDKDCKRCQEILNYYGIKTKKNFNDWSRKYHPDKYNSEGGEKLLEQERIFKLVKRCYDYYFGDEEIFNRCNLKLGEEDEEKEDEEKEDEEKEEKKKKKKENGVSEKRLIKELKKLGTYENLVKTYKNSELLALELLNRLRQKGYKLKRFTREQYFTILSYLDELKEENLENQDIKFTGRFVEFRKPDTTIKNKGWISHKTLDNNLLCFLSPKLVALIVNILKNYNSKHVVFSFFLNKSGIRLIHNILKLCGIKSHMYTGDLSDEQRGSILKRFNDENNRYGDKMRVLLSTEAGGEGISLLEVGHVHIFETNTVPNKTLQAIGRAVRYRSHINMPVDKQNVNVWKYFSIAYGLDPTEFIETAKTFDDYYEYYVKGGCLKNLKSNKSGMSLKGTEEVSVDYFLNKNKELKIEKFNIFYELLQRNSIENTGLI